VLFVGAGLFAKHTWAARMFLRVANLHGGFDNSEKDVDGLRKMHEVFKCIAVRDTLGRWLSQYR
jgi:hypothetical protein